MPTFPEHYLLAFGGHIGPDATTVNEEWQNTLRFTSDSPVPSVDADATYQAILGDVWTDTAAWFTTADNNFSDQVWLSWVKFNKIATTGKYANPTTYEAQHTPVRGTSSTGMLPPQNSLVLSFTTAVNRGRASKGRIFLPPMTTNVVDFDGRIKPLFQTPMLTAAKTWLTNLNNWPGIDGVTGINLQAAIVSSVDGSHRPITGLRLGRVIDTHRSRRRSMVEDYATLAL